MTEEEFWGRSGEMFNKLENEKKPASVGDPPYYGVMQHRGGPNVASPGSWGGITPAAVGVNPGSQWIRDAKSSEGKPKAFQVLAGFSKALLEVVKVSQYGYKKHTEKARDKLIQEERATREQAEDAIPYNNWQNGTVDTYDDAMMRHVLARGAGETHAEDSGLLHRAHEAWNALAALTLYLMETSKNVK